MNRNCKNCGRLDRLDYGVTDGCWYGVVPEELRPEIVCIECFDRLAKIAGVEWSQHIQYIKFEGESGGFVHYPD